MMPPGGLDNCIVIMGTGGVCGKPATKWLWDTGGKVVVPACGAHTWAPTTGVKYLTRDEAFVLTVLDS